MPVMSLSAELSSPGDVGPVPAPISRLNSPAMPAPSTPGKQRKSPQTG